MEMNLTIFIPQQYVYGVSNKRKKNVNCENTISVHLKLVLKP